MAIGALIFDLDGTLTDPYVGISRSYLHALATIGRPAIGEDELRDLIGPPIQQAFARLCGDEPQLVDDAVRAYRERYSEIGLFENTVYPDIPAALAALGQTFRLFVCTSKPRVFAARILERFGLAEHFTTIYGAELDGTRADKRELLQWVIDRESLEPGACVMIGDREFDAEAALSTGMPFIGVLWGFGTRAELSAAGATVFAATPGDLAGNIRRAECEKRP